MAWAPEGCEGRYQAGPKGPKPARRLLVSPIIGFCQTGPTWYFFALLAELGSQYMIQFLFVLFTDYSVLTFALLAINDFLRCKIHWHDNIRHTLQKGQAHWKVNNERVLLHEKSWQLTKHTASTRLAFYVSRLNCRQESFVIWRHGKVIKTFSWDFPNSYANIKVLAFSVCFNVSILKLERTNKSGQCHSFFL